MITLRLDQVATYVSGSLRIDVAPFTLSAWQSFQDEALVIKSTDKHDASQKLLSLLQRAIVATRYDDAPSDTPLKDLLTQYEIEELATFVGSLNTVGPEDLGKLLSQLRSKAADSADDVVTESAASDTPTATIES